MFEITHTEDAEITSQSLKNIEEDGKYFLTLSLSNKGKTYKLPNEPLISLSRKKRIIKTQVGTRTVKEFIGFEDYQITIRGVCVGDNNYPNEQVNILSELERINDVLEIVNNKFLALFGIYAIVITSISFDEMEGQPHLQGYTIKAISDEAYYAELKTLR